MELLAPAGNTENLIAAVQSGCDAIYLGGTQFSARANATNFTLESLKESIQYCHHYGVKVYVTVNTLLRDDEVLEAVDYCVELHNLGVDAIIIQDFGLVRLLRDNYPEIELHASTQMSIHNLEGAKFLKELGFSRVVLARECSLEEIRTIHQHCDIELEIFVQGALCISYSGQCLMSSLIGGRSGNRGRCAQACRLPYKMEEDGQVVEEGYLLSPKDLSLVDELQQIKEAGVTSLKIEGRLKQASYVVETTEMFYKVLHQLPYSKENVAKTFIRSGYTTAYFKKKPLKDMMSLQKPNHSGIKVGIVKNGRVHLLLDLSVGDGVRIEESGFQVEKILVNKQKVTGAQKGDVVEVFPKKYQEGDILYKSFDFKLATKAKQVIQRPYERKRLIDCHVIFKVGEPLCLYGDGFNVQGEMVEQAIKRPVSMETLHEQLLKSGESAYQLNLIDIDYEAGFLPLSLVNECRRACFEALDQLFEQVIPLEKRKLKKDISISNQSNDKMVIIRKKEHLHCQWHPSLIRVLNPYFRDEGSLTKSDVKACNENFWIQLPSILKQECQQEVDWVLSLKHCVGVITSNVGAMSLLKGKLPVIGDYKLNLLNSYGFDLFPDLQGSLLSEELNRSQLAAIVSKEHYLINIYSRLEMMVSEYCPNRTGDVCDVVCKNHQFTLQDRLGFKIPLNHDLFCRVHLMNSKIKNWMELFEELREMGYSRFVMELQEESQEEAQRLLDAFVNEQKCQVSYEVTYGHYNRGVL